jgi:hypothetical protein
VNNNVLEVFLNQDVLINLVQFCNFTSKKLSCKFNSFSIVNFKQGFKELNHLNNNVSSVFSGIIKHKSSTNL